MYRRCCHPTMVAHAFADAAAARDARLNRYQAVSTSCSWGKRIYSCRWCFCTRCDRSPCSLSAGNQPLLQQLLASVRSLISHKGAAQQQQQQKKSHMIMLSQNRTCTAAAHESDCQARPATALLAADHPQRQHFEPYHHMLLSLQQLKRCSAFMPLTVQTMYRQMHKTQPVQTHYQPHHHCVTQCEDTHLHSNSCAVSTYEQPLLQKQLLKRLLELHI